MPRTRLTDRIAKTTSITERLDTIATELEQVDPRIALAIDQVSDRLDGKGKYIDMSKTDFDKAHVTSYSGGSTWLKFNDKTVVIPAMSPVKIQSHFEHSPQETIRGEIWKGPSHPPA